jgi:Ca2+-binding RTX toxin-like protein
MRLCGKDDSSSGSSIARLVVLVVGMVGFSAAPAVAASVEVVNGTAVVTAAPGERNDIRAGTRVIRDGLSLRIDDAGAPLTAGAGCQQLAAGSVWCPEESGRLGLDVSTANGDDRVLIDDVVFRLVTVHAGPGRDTVHVGSSVGTPALIDGGPGDDDLSAAMNSSDRPVLKGGAGDDLLTITEGAGGEELGGNGDDRIIYVGSLFRHLARLDGGNGNDTYTFLDQFEPAAMVAGRGFDSLDQSTAFRPLEFDMADCAACVERVIGTAGADRITGDANPQTILGGDGDDTLDGGGGPDVVGGQGGDDTLAGQDGFIDALSCGAGTDAATADRFDIVDQDCETVSRSPAL